LTATATVASPPPVFPEYTAWRVAGSTVGGGAASDGDGDAEGGVEDDVGAL
jgi:hypothetical protein